MEAVAASATAVQRLQPDTVYCREPRVQRPRDRMKNVQDGDCLLSGLAFSRLPRPPYPHFLESRSNFSFLEARGTQGGPGDPGESQGAPREPSVPIPWLSPGPPWVPLASLELHRTTLTTGLPSGSSLTSLELHRTSLRRALTQTSR